MVTPKQIAALKYLVFNAADPFNCDGIFAGWSESQVVHLRLVRKGMLLRYTFWLAKNDYSRQASLIVADRSKLEKIDLKKPGLYPSLESA